MKPKKEYGQNFLRDKETIETLVSVSNPQKTDNYLEIGPGEGVVTQILAEQVGKVIAVELDSDLLPNLKELSDAFNNITVVHGDIIRLLRDHELIHDSKINKIIGSLPYQITSPLLHSLANLSITSSIQSVTILLQKEVAQKITAVAPDASYLSNFVQTYFDAKFIGNVSRERFYPIPKVDGAIVCLIPRKSEPNSVILVSKAHPGSTSVKTTADRSDSGQARMTDDIERWSEFLHKAFKFPRKMLRKVFDEKILEGAGIGPTQRPQEINLETWKKLYNLDLCQHRHSGLDPESRPKEI